MDRCSISELRVAETIARGEKPPMVGAGDSIAEQVERAPRGTYGEGFAEMLRVMSMYSQLTPHLVELVSLRASGRAKHTEMKGAAAGPVVTVIGAVLACSVASAWILPAFDRWMLELEITAPASFLLSRSVMTAVFGPVGIVLVCAVLVGFAIGWHRGALGRFTFRSRVVAAPIRAMAMRTLAIAFDCEIPTKDALRLCAAVISHSYASERLLGVRRASREGAALWDLLGRSRVVPFELLTSVRAADGQTIGAALNGLARYFAVEAEAGSMRVRVLVGATVTVFAAILCMWLAVTIALGYTAVIG